MVDITVIGLGPGSYGALSQETVEIIKKKQPLFLRTIKHPVVPFLIEKGLMMHQKSFDQYYENYETFEEVYREIVDTLVKEARKGPVTYAVPGHPMVAEDSVSLLQRVAKEQGMTVKIMPAMSFLDCLFSAVNYDPINGIKIIDAFQVDKQPPEPAVANIVVQVYSPIIAQDLKISLMDYYPDEFTITVARALGVEEEEKIVEIPLYELDRLPWLDYLTSVFIPPLPGASGEGVKYPIDPLVRVMQKLRGPEGCPWDREQNHRSLRKYLIEETYEVLDAIDEGNMNKICEELGDLLLQIAFHAQIADEAGFFDINDIVEGIVQKLIRRHPHVFGDIRVSTSAEVSRNWDKIKENEKKGEPESKSVLDGIPAALPSLLKAEKIQKKAAKVGFDWPDYIGAMEKVKEELMELLEAINENSLVQIEEEMGDLFFSLVNVARLLKVDPETVLNETNRKFVSRFKSMEDKALQLNKKLSDMNLEEMDILWKEAKNIPKG